MNTKINESDKNISQKLVEKIQKNMTVDKEFVFKYIPFLENDVILIQHTQKTVFILLKNGTILYFFPEGNSNKINVYDNKNFLIPNSIKIPTKISDLACGYDHCLALGVNSKIYSWGSNSYGQLGLPDVLVDNEARKDEPSEIPRSSFIKLSNIIRVLCKNNTSYAISENNYLYGWGIVIYICSNHNIINRSMLMKAIPDLKLKK